METPERAAPATILSQQAANATAHAPKPQHSDGVPLSVSPKRGVVRRLPAGPTSTPGRHPDAMQGADSVPRFPGDAHPHQRPSVTPTRAARTPARESVCNSAMSSVARNRAAMMQEYIKSAGLISAVSSTPQRGSDWATRATQTSVRRRRELSPSPSGTYGAVEERRGASAAQMESVARTARNPYTARSICESATAPPPLPPFELLSAGRPVPRLPAELDEAITAYYLSCLRQLPIAHQERVVSAIATERDRKAVIAYLRQQQEAHPAPTTQAAPSSSAAVPPHPMPRKAPASARDGASRRRVMREHQTPALQRQSSATAESHAVERFLPRFAAEACAAFLDDATDVCIARRARCYQAQPPIVKDLAIVLPEELIMPLYIESVSALLYNVIGWTKAESRSASRAVVEIVHRRMPTVVSSPDGTITESAAAQGTRPLQTTNGTPTAAPRPPVPVAPRMAMTPVQQQCCQRAC
ncbi:hypothetical protein NESM_000429800 [Novymonas esmeraldas]|uniref:Uncharacterized protein n=1 Tax=Novymonas esmeraldas TaxID=1808958 RepID=A0AAW0EN24_9TRYP